jgi:hypothetical protein
MACGLGERTLSRRLVIGVVACLALSGVIAWLVYYRAMAGMAVATLTSFHAEHGNVRVRWVHVGKILQNTLLKFGGAPLVFAVWGLHKLPPRLRSLTHGWLAVTALLAVVAVVSPIAFRFEYFVIPAVALAAGQEISSRSAKPGRRWIVAAWLFPFAIQAALAWALFAGSFDPINVIIPGERWPLIAGDR